MALKFPYIIAEAGTGHQGLVMRALKLVDFAKAAGADAVKFQMFVKGEDLFCPLEGDERRKDWWDKTALRYGSWEVVKIECDARGIDFLASVFQPTAVKWLKDLNPVAYKVASRAAKTYPYHEVPGPFIISSGFFDRYDIYDECSGTLTTENHYFLQCTSKYPAPLHMAAYNKREGCAGLSDHSGTPWPAMDALSRGAKIIEVHIGDKEGPDAAVNLSFEQLKLICDFRDALAEMREG